MKAFEVLSKQIQEKIHESERSITMLKGKMNEAFGQYNSFVSSIKEREIDLSQYKETLDLLLKMKRESSKKKD